MREPFITAIRLERGRVENPEAFPFSLPCVRNLDRLELDPRITFLVGENGVGKSTLAEAIAIALRFNPEGGSRNFNFATRDSFESSSRMTTGRPLAPEFAGLRRLPSDGRPSP